MTLWASLEVLQNPSLALLSLMASSLLDWSTLASVLFRRSAPGLELKCVMYYREMIPGIITWKKIHCIRKFVELNIS